jgi:hypothetical protein
VSSNPTDENAYTVRDKFTHDNTTIVPDRGRITFTVDSSRPNEYAFTVSDADGNILGDGIFTDIEFSIASFHISQQPDIPAKPDPAQPE